ncbi:MAG: PspC domain-containing protein, partial [Actinobacteria bacterium]|nr:PspC domain-containing protein [Actinomycetota bacterium]
METNQPGQPGSNDPPAPTTDGESVGDEPVDAQQAPTEAVAQPDRSRFWVRRDLNDKIVGGVSAGIGRRYNVDPVLLRVLFVVGTLAFLAGPLAYLALWLLLPTTASKDPSPLTRSLWRMVLGVFLALGAAGALLGWFGSLGGVMGVIVGGSTVALGYWLYSRPRVPVPPYSEEPTSHPGAEYGPGSPGSVPVVQAGGEVAYSYPSLPSQQPPRQRVPRSYLGLIVFLASIVVFFTLIVASTAGLFSINAVVIMSVTLAVLSVGLIIGAFRGWSRLLIIPALGLALIIGIGAQVSDQVSTYADSGVGEQIWVPTSSDTYRLGIGAAELNLVPWANNDMVSAPKAGDSIAASVGAG